MRKSFFPILLLVLLAALTASAWAQTTAAGVIITNQASADFIDSSSNAQTTISNAVEVVVLPVYGFNVEPDRAGTGADQDPSGNAANNGLLSDADSVTGIADNVNDKDVSAGDTTFFSYTIENNANTNDTFTLEIVQDAQDDFDLTGLQIYTYTDANGNGVYDPATEAGSLVLLGGDSATLNLPASDGTADSGPDFRDIVVFGTVPPGTPGGEIAQIDLTATSQGEDGDGDTDTTANVLYENNNISRATVTETPVIGIAKRVNGTPTNNGDGTYTVPYVLVVENLGNVELTNVAVTDDLTATFGAPATVNAVSTPTVTVTTAGTPGTTSFTANAAFNGDADQNVLEPAPTVNTLAIGGVVEISFNVTVGTPVVGTTYNNQAVAQGTSSGPGAATVGDFSDDGTDPDPNGNSDPGADPTTTPTAETPGSDADDPDEDTPTPVTFTENPSIGISKVLNSVTPVSGSPGEYNVAFTLRVENFGDVPLSNIQVTEDLNATFDFGNTDVVSITSGPTTLANTRVSATDAPTTNSGFNLDPAYTGTGANTMLTGANNLAVGEYTTIAFTVRINIDSDGAGGTPAGPGSYTNTATTAGNSPSGTNVTDTSQNGTDPDPDSDDDPTNNNDPTPINITEEPIIGTAKSVGAVQDNGDGTYNVPYVITITNYGTVDLSNVQVTDDLTATFVNPSNPQPTFTVIGGSITSPTLAVNTGFNGNTNTDLLAGTDTLAVGATATVSFTVQVTPNVAQGTYNNQAIGSGDSPGGTTVTDTSHNGTDPDPDDDDDPSNNSDPTPITIPTDPVIGVAKRVTSVTETPASSGIYRVVYTLVVENLGGIALSNVQVQDNLTSTFNTTPFAITVPPTATGGLTANAGYNGTADINLLDGTDTLAVGATATITLTVDVTPASVPTVQYDNQATATATDPSGGVSTTDLSDDGFDPDTDGDGNPNETDDGVTGNGTDSDSNENDPTPLIILAPSDLELAKVQRICADATCSAGPVPGKGDTNAQLTAEPGQFIVYTITGTNSSTDPVTNVVISDVIPTPTVFVTSALNTVSQGTLECRLNGATTFSNADCGTPANVVEVRLNDNGGTVAAAGTVTLTFVVQIP